MKFNKWTVGLAAVGVVSLASAARADEQMSQVQTALSSTTLSGYVDTAATWRPGTDQKGGTSPNIPAYSFAKNDGFSLNAVDIALDKPMDESPWAAGYHVEMMYGPDAVGVALSGATYTPASFGPGGPPAGYTSGSLNPYNAVTLRQAYLALRTPIGNSGIDWKVGVWDTIIGYESSSSPLDPNYTRSYGYSIEPTTHTGILGTYTINDMISVSAGIANDAFGNSFTPTTTYESQKAYMGSLTFTAPDSFGPMKGATLTGGVINSVGSSAYGSRGSTSWYAGTTIPTPLNALKAGASFDYLDVHNGGGEAWVVGVYGSYQANDKLSFNLRGEYGQNDNPNVLNNTVTGFRNTFEEVTATASYQLWANVISRVEFRWDHVEHGNAFGANGPNPNPTGLANAGRANDFLLALNLIYQF